MSQFFVDAILLRAGTEVFSVSRLFFAHLALLVSEEPENLNQLVHFSGFEPGQVGTRILDCKRGGLLVHQHHEVLQVNSKLDSRALFKKPRPVSVAKIESRSVIPTL